MNKKKKTQPYVLTEIPNFDARRGYKKCSPPGVGAGYAGDMQRADGDFWRNESENVVVRFSSLGYRFSFEARLPSGTRIPENQMDDFAMFVSELLVLWIIEGVDDNPSTEL